MTDLDPKDQIPTLRKAVGTITNPPLRAKETEMQWTDKIPLSATDEKAWGNKSGGTPFKVGAMVSAGDMLRYPALAGVTDAEVDQALFVITIETSVKGGKR